MRFFVWCTVCIFSSAAGANSSTSQVNPTSAAPSTAMSPRAYDTCKELELKVTALAGECQANRTLQALRERLVTRAPVQKLARVAEELAINRCDYHAKDESATDSRTPPVTFRCDNLIAEVAICKRQIEELSENKEASKHPLALAFQAAFDTWVGRCRTRAVASCLHCNPFGVIYKDCGAIVNTGDAVDDSRTDHR